MAKKRKTTETTTPKAPVQALFPTEEAALQEAATRTKGPRRAFRCAVGDQIVYVVSTTRFRAAFLAYKELGGAVEELGRKAKRIAAQVKALSNGERAALLEQLSRE